MLKPVQRSALYEALAAASARGRAGRRRCAADAAAIAPLGAHVLLVEDEPVNAAVAQGYLGALGCTSVWVEDGAEAATRNAAERFDLILMDLSMPAWTASRPARSSASAAAPAGACRIVALTAHDAASYATPARPRAWTTC